MFLDADHHTAVKKDASAALRSSKQVSGTALAPNGTFARCSQGQIPCLTLEAPRRLWIVQLLSAVAPAVLSAFGGGWGVSRGVIAVLARAMVGCSQETSEDVVLQ